MTPEHITLVRASWPAIAAHADALTRNFYTYLFEIDDSAARLFAGVDMTALRTKLAQSLAVVVQSIDDVDRLLPALAALGKRHATYGVEDRHFDSVGHALLRAFSTTLGDEFTTPLHDAWSEAYGLIAAVMRRALVRALTDCPSPASI
jgi:hemoglobin-like flavoprotein